MQADILDMNLTSDFDIIESSGVISYAKIGVENILLYIGLYSKIAKISLERKLAFLA